jgi:hypothetical protein
LTTDRPPRRVANPGISRRGASKEKAADVVETKPEPTNEAPKEVVAAAPKAAGGAVRPPPNRSIEDIIKTSPGAARAKTGIAEPLNLGAARGEIENSAYLKA